MPAHCPKCGSLSAKKVWESEDGKHVAIRCPRKHVHGNIKRSSEEAPRMVKNLVFLVRLQ